jgi:hypothetical protein
MRASNIVGIATTCMALGCGSNITPSEHADNLKQQSTYGARLAACYLTQQAKGDAGSNRAYLACACDVDKEFKVNSGACDGGVTP